MERDQHFWPSTVYFEGLDQYRGWFQSSLLVAVGALGRGAPFKECITHGWTVDGEGRAMHKSLGNGMDPNEIIQKYGADLLRLWAGSADYHVDVRCSDEIFKQLSQNYLKFRNTSKFCLDNLVGFDPDHLVAPEEMMELDKWAVTRLNALITKVFAAYDDYEFHAITHAVNDFCVIDLSSFYFDIIKDRLYCDEADGPARRSAQTALWMILDAMTRLFAPILAFTCDEIWLAMPHREGDDPRNVVFNQMVQPYAAYALDEAAMERWDNLFRLRDGVNVALEQARADKKIGKSLEAHVVLAAKDGSLDELEQHFAGQWADLFIVSDVEVSHDEAVYDAAAETPLDGVRVQVSEARGAKCGRCWKHHPMVGQDAKYPDLCPRCAAVMAKIPQIAE
jgi:isoleucyl-tRNA synthetase